MRSMSWIKDFSQSSVAIYKGNVLEGFQPIDFFHFYPLWYDLLVARIAAAIRKLDLEQKKYSEIRNFLPGPSNIRALYQKIIPAYYAYRADNRQDYRLVANFFARMLQEACPEDHWGLATNRLHTPEEIRKITKDIGWENVNLKNAREVGQFITAASSLVHGLYNDLATDFGWDIYGPYMVEQEGKKYSLLIRHFTDMRPTELWPEKDLPKEKEIFLYTLYEGIEWEVKYVGCHMTPINGSPVLGMRKSALAVDGKAVPQEALTSLTADYGQRAVAIYKKVRQMSFEELKVLILRQECYQFKKLFERAEMDWQPTMEMLERIRDKPLLEDIFPRGTMINTVKEFEEIFGVKVFKREVLGG